jgi:hypothetical protein
MHCFTKPQVDIRYCTYYIYIHILYIYNTLCHWISQPWCVMEGFNSVIATFLFRNYRYNLLTLHIEMISFGHNLHWLCTYLQWTIWYARALSNANQGTRTCMATAFLILPLTEIRQHAISNTLLLCITKYSNYSNFCYVQITMNIYRFSKAFDP